MDDGVVAVELRGVVGGGDVGDAEGMFGAAVVQRVGADDAAAAEVARGATFLVQHLGGAVNPGVQDEDESHGDVESAERGVDGVAHVIVLDDALLSPVPALPPDQRRNGDEDGDEPDDGHHDASAPGRPLAGVLDGFSDGPVAIERDHTQMHDGAGAAGHVDTQPRLAHERPQQPGLGGDVEDADGHHQHGHQ